MLQKLKNISSLFLLWLFLYPIAFQLVHTMLEVHIPNNLHHCCGSHCSAPDEPAKADSGFQLSSAAGEDCIICEFHYAVITGPDDNSLSLLQEDFFNRILAETTHPYLRFQGYIHSLRAPPYPFISC